MSKQENSLQNQVCLRMQGIENSWTLAQYEKAGGYTMWRKILQEQMSPKEIVTMIKDSLLRGRGGAGFSTGMKMGFISPDAATPRYLVCNSDEGEPGTCKDTLILRFNPHQLLEGMLIACYAQGMETGYNYLRGEYMQEFYRCESALKEARGAGLIGDNILGLGINIELHNLLGAGSYIVGEETAMLESIEGKRGMPRIKPPFPAYHGLYGQPTTINNTETLASLPVILSKGSQWFSTMGSTQSGGMKIFCVSGHVQKPGVFECPMGIPFKDLLALAGGMRPGRTLKAVIPGGSSMKVLPADVIMHTTMDYESLQKVGSAIGSGGVIVMDDSTCMVSALACISKFYYEESCGQCTPCREGTGWVMRLVAKIHRGEGELKDIDLLDEITQKAEGRTICAFGEAFCWPVQSFIANFYDEFAYFVRHKRSMVAGDK